MKQFFACFAFTLLIYGSFQQAIDAEQYPETSPAANQTSGGNWKYSGVIYLLTTPEGANLPAGTTLEGFPVLVRLNQESLNFSQAQPHGEDQRVRTADGTQLPYQIEEWDPGRGEAVVWVRVPKIVGNAKQELHVAWGNSEAKNESNGQAVFNESNGFASVWHLNNDVIDSVGTLQCKDAGTTPVSGRIGQARHFAGKQGIFGGDKIKDYPKGNGQHTTELWLRAERANGTIIAWGNEEGGRGSKIRMQFRSPPHVYVDSNFTDIQGKSRLALHEWIHVVHVYGDGPRRFYIDGKFDTDADTTIDIKSPAKLWIGGWYNNYDFMGAVDEVRVSRVARSAEWIRLCYENQKPMQTLVGSLVKKGNAFSVSPPDIKIGEGKSVKLTAQADGALKTYWVLARNGEENVVAVDRTSYEFDAGRVQGNENAKLILKAVYPNEVKTKQIPITIQEEIAEPLFTLQAPLAWDGRATIEVVPIVSNLAKLQASGAGELKIDWKVSGLATIKEAVPGKLLLKRAQNSGPLTVTATVSNGGAPATHSVKIMVTEPTSDPWVMRTPDQDEKPQAGQFYARDAQGEGTLEYRGTLAEAAETVYLKIFADDKPYHTVTAKVAADRSYALSARLKPGLVKYRVEFGSVKGGHATLLESVGDLLCGDAYLIQGQSNALSTDTREEAPAESHEWIRSYGKPRPGKNGPQDQPENLWCKPVWKSKHGDQAELGWWGMELAKRLVESQKVPIFILNGAVGGTRIDEHRRNEADPVDLNTIYGRTLWRLRQAKLTHGIRAVLWHQGESNQSAWGPTGDYDWKTYQDEFVELTSAWKRDFPNIQHYYVFQIWPNACSIAGKTGSGDKLREVQRKLPLLYSRMSLMSTLGIKPGGTCHYPLVGWSEFARLIQPLIERNHYGRNSSESVTPPNLRKAYFSTPKNDSVVLEFDQPIVWNEKLVGEFAFDGEKIRVASGVLAGNMLTLKLERPTNATTVSYLQETNWSQDKLIYGANGIAALTFCDVPLQPFSQSGPASK